MSKPFENQTALVTGASRGIGAATAIALAEAGAHVILTARTDSDLEKVEDSIHQAGGSATIAPLDLTDSDSIARLATAVRERWDSLDIMICNAAMLGTLGPAPTIDGKEFNQLLTLNLLSQQALIAGFHQSLTASENSRVLAISSGVAQRPRAFWGAYAASKAALEALFLSYADEQRNLGKPRVGIINPGGTRTNMRAKAFPGEDPETLKPPEVVADRIVEILASDFETGTRFDLNLSD